MNQYDLVVIGGGISGLVLASRAGADGLSTLLVEREDRLGGCLRTWQATPDFWLELGAHTAYNSYRAMLEVLAERGALGRLARREKLGYLFLDGDRVQSPLARLRWLELLTHLPLGVGRKQAGKSLAEHYGALFGRGNYARVFSPAFAAVLSQPADAFPAQWLFRRKARMKEAPRKYTWPTGLQGLAEALAGDAPFEVALGTPVDRVARADDGYTLQAGQATVRCRYLGIATEPDVAARLLAEAHPDLAERLRRIPMADIESLAVTVPAGQARLPRLAGLIGVDDDFHSVVSRDPVPHETLRGFTFHFRPGRLDEAGKLARAARVLGVAPEDLLDHRAALNRLPAMRVEHVALAGELDELLRERPLLLAGSYFNGLSIGDCADRAAREAARLRRMRGGA
jgi:protoporphyrinogen oxidase